MWCESIPAVGAQWGGWTRVHTVFAVWIVVLSALTLVVDDSNTDPAATAGPSRSTSPAVRPSGATPSAPATRTDVPLTLPGGRTTVFGGQMLVAYYGTPGTGALGVLGEAPPLQIWPRLEQAAAAFERPGRRVQPVFEVIASVARSGPGRDGDYSTDVSRAAVESYIRAAHEVGALVVLDIQTGRSDFLKVARRWKWALEDPWVGLAIDPEWRVHGQDRPGQVIGHVDAGEVNRVSLWLSNLTHQSRLPQKLFIIHQFRTSMVLNPGAIRNRANLAMVQHVDGFGTPHDKLATYHAVARPRQFHEGFKLFYKADTRMMSPAAVLRIRPRVDFVSYQ